MARNVELGTVGFNLEAVDDSLVASLANLRAFGEAVTRASNATDEAGIRSYQTMVKVERVLTSAFDRVHALTEGLKAVGADTSAVDKLVGDYQRLTDAMIKARGGAESHEFVRAQVGIGAATSQANRALTEQQQITRVLEARTTSLFNAWDRAENAASRFKIQGAGGADVAKFNEHYEKFAAATSHATLSSAQLKEAQRLFNQEMHETNRTLKEQIAQMKLAEHQQTRYISATRNVAYVNARVMRTGLPSSYVNTNNEALQALGAALSTGNQASIIGAQQRLNDVMMATRLAMAGAEKPTSAFSLAMKDMSKASVLALGPLSGVGARIGVMTSLLESNSIATALFIGGAVAMGATLYGISRASIQAASDQQKFNALLTTSTGATALAAQEYEYLLGVANRMGTEIRTLVQPYAQFSAAARSANFPLETQRKIFESIITTGTALRWNQEQTSRAFLAITQMISKTTVMSEEYKKQLGELIPNVIGLGAAAENTSTQGLMKMMKDSKLMATEHLPLLSTMLVKVFGTGATEGAKTLTADVARYRNSLFELSKVFDTATGASKTWQLVVQGATASANWLAKNIDNIVLSIITLTGATAGGALVKLFTWLPGAIAGTTTVLAYATGGIAGLRAALVALETTTVVGWLLKLTVVVTSAAMAWAFFRDKQKEALGETLSINDKFREWIQQQEAMGETQAQVRDRMVALGGPRVEELKKQVDNEKKELARLQKFYTDTHAYKLSVARGMPLPPQGDALTQQYEKVQALTKEYTDLIQMMQQAESMKLAPDPKTGLDGAGEKAWKTWSDQVTRHIEEATGKMREFNALKSGGESAREMAESLTRAKILLQGMPEGKQNLTALSESLNKAGFAGKTLEEQFTAMFVAQERAGAGIRNFNSDAKEQATAVGKLVGLWTDLQQLEQAANGDANFGADKAKKNKELMDNLEKLRGYYKAIGMEEVTMTALLDDYTNRWKALVATEDHQKRIEKVTEALDKMGLKVGDTMQKAQAAIAKQIEFLDEGVKLGLISEIGRADMIAKLNADLYRKMTKGATEYYEALHQMFGRIENGMVDALTGGKPKEAFKSLLEDMVREVMGFIVRIAVIKPMMASLFGSLYTGRQSDGMTDFGNALLRIGGMFFGGPTGGSAAGVDTGMIDWGDGSAFPMPGRAFGGKVDPFGEYMVGEEGPERLKMTGNGGVITSSHRLSQTSGGYTDNSRRTYNIDARSDVATIMQVVGRANREQSKQVQRMLKVRYG